jgi:hypothetical protein
VTNLFAQLLTNAEGLEPNDPEWPTHLMYIYIDLVSLGTRAEYLPLAFAKGDRALQTQQQPGEMHGLLTALCNFALEVGELERSERYANAMLQLAIEREVSHRQFIAHGLLGLIAVRREDVESAETELIRASECEFFPAYRLPNELLRLGRTESVSAFLEICAPKAGKHQQRLTEWACQLRSGRLPFLQK